MWKRLLELGGFYESPACRAASQALRRTYPDSSICGARLIKQEAARWVVAVFYDEPGVIVRPTQYKLFAVSSDLACVEELPRDVSSPYWIRGRK